MSARTDNTSEAAQPPREGMEGILRSMRLIQADCEADANATEGAPLTGRVVGENFGGIYAMIQAVARAVELLAECAA